jgi:hypothetical protein
MKVPRTAPRWRFSIRKEPSAGRIVLFTRNGRFWLYDSAGRPREEDVAEPGGLFEALAALLKASDRRALNFDDSDLAEQLRNALIEQLPATRSGVLARLGWRVSTPWFNPGRRLADGRVGYELGGAPHVRPPSGCDSGYGCCTPLSMPVKWKAMCRDCNVTMSARSKRSLGRSATTRV